VSHHDPSDIILKCFAAQETFIIMINVENSCVASYLYENIHFLRFSDEQKAAFI